MNDSAITPVRPERTNVRTDCSWYPRAFLTDTELFWGAQILTGKGKAAFRDHVGRLVRLPAEGSAEHKRIEDEIQGAVELFRDLNEDPDCAAEQVDGQDAVIDRWARSGVIPPLAEAIAELSMPGLTDECTDIALKHFPGWAERAAEREELASYRVERWLKGNSPFKEHDWLPRAALWDQYSIWCKFDGGGHDAGKPADFYVALKDLGCSDAKRQGTRGFLRPKH